MRTFYEFTCGAEMLYKLTIEARDLYNEDYGLYVFIYNDYGSIAVYGIDKISAQQFREAQKEGRIEYWSDVLGYGGSIYDDRIMNTIDPDFPEIPVSNLDYCKEIFAYGKWEDVTGKEVIQ